MRSLLFIPLFLISCQAGVQNANEKIKFFVGSSDRSLENPIVLCKLDLSTGEISKIDSFAGTRSASYIALSPDNEYLYSVNSESAGDEKNSQMITSFSVDSASSELKLLNSQSSEGRGPCHISVHPSGKYVFTANYSSGTIAVHPLNNDGSLGEATDVEQHEGSGPNEERQEAAHAHFICADQQGKFVLAVDLGIDKVMNYLFDEFSGELIPNPVRSFYTTAPGAGPRHLDFHPSGNFVYVLNELNGTLSACTFNTETGVMNEINTLSTLPGDFAGFNKSAAVRVHPNGKYVYASNRGDLNSIAVFKIQDDGSVELIQVQEKNINFPRDFNIDPSGNWLLAGNQHGRSIVVFSIDQATGELIETEHKLEISQPTCIVFLED